MEFPHQYQFVVEPRFLNPKKMNSRRDSQFHEGAEVMKSMCACVCVCVWCVCVCVDVVYVDVCGCVYWPGVAL